MKLLVTGGRDFDDEPFVYRTLDFAHRRFKGFTSLVHGKARGLDNIADAWAKSRGVEPIPYPANWDNLGKKAGPVRNQKMWTEEYINQTPLNKIDIVLSFPGGDGTDNMTEIAITQQRLEFFVPVYKVYANGLRLLNQRALIHHTHWLAGGTD